MGFKLSIFMLLLLLGTIGGSATYIKLLKADLAIAKGNQMVLEGKVAEQNESIERHLAQQKKISMQMSSMEAEKNNALREFNDLRNKFARHDMNSLALAKPEMIQKRVNNGTMKVKLALIQLTDPNQFDPEKQEPEVKKQGSTPPPTEVRPPEGAKIDVPEPKSNIRG